MLTRLRANFCLPWEFQLRKFANPKVSEEPQKRRKQGSQNAKHGYSVRRILRETLKFLKSEILKMNKKTSKWFHFAKDTRILVVQSWFQLKTNSPLFREIIASCPYPDPWIKASSWNLGQLIFANFPKVVAFGFGSWIPYFWIENWWFCTGYLDLYLQKVVPKQRTKFGTWTRHH